jgi:hypothetical protein
MSKSRILQVPYLPQPTEITCQSTVLKMFAMYLGRDVTLQSTRAGNASVDQIWKAVNVDPKRPSPVRNAHANMKWWLETQFPTLKFQYVTTRLEWEAVEQIVAFVDRGFPVLVAVSHAQVEGHIILVVGYENYRPNQSSMDFQLVVHDPYGAFDPTLRSKLFGGRRWEGGSSLMGGGDLGPGREVRLPITGVSRHRPGDKYSGTYYLLSAAR